MTDIVDMTEVLTPFNESIRIFRMELLTTNGCGNKEFKLTKNIRRLTQRGCSSVLSFGGVWSNHLHALSLHCESAGIRAVAAVRGEETPGSTLLNDAIAHGLQVHYLSRSDYRKRHDESYLRHLLERFNCDAWLPEGGSNALAVSGCEAITAQINKIADKAPTHIALAVGTGATAAGVINAANVDQQVLGIPVVQDDRLSSSINTWQISSVPWRLLDTARPAKYGKVDNSLLEFVLSTYDSTGVILDPVYNAKALRALLESSVGLEPDHDIVFVHTGGIGGCLGFSGQLDNIDAGIASRLLAEVRKMLGISGSIA